MNDPLSLSAVRIILWVLAGVGLIAFALLSVWATRRGEPREVQPDPPFYADFSLTDQRGNLRTDEDFAGRWMLVFFGFANCPDICPTTLVEVSLILKELGGDADKVQPLFISVDPERDTIDELANYLPNFDERIVGLTGTVEQIDKTATSFRIYYEKIEEPSTPAGYTMAHSSQLFLFDRSGGFVTSYSYGTPAEEVALDLEKRMRQ